MSGVNFASIIAGSIFSAVGFAAFIYGKKQAIVKPMLIGSGLMVYPYFFSDTMTIVVIGAVLTSLLFILRD